MAMVGIDCGRLEADSQLKSFDLVWGSVAAFTEWTGWTLASQWLCHDESSIKIWILYYYYCCCIIVGLCNYAIGIIWLRSRPRLGGVPIAPRPLALRRHTTRGQRCFAVMRWRSSSPTFKHLQRSTSLILHVCEAFPSAVCVGQDQPLNRPATWFVLLSTFMVT